MYESEAPVFPQMYHVHCGIAHLACSCKLVFQASARSCWPKHCSSLLYWSATCPHGLQSTRVLSMWMQRFPCCNFSSSTHSLACAAQDAKVSCSKIQHELSPSKCSIFHAAYADWAHIAQLMQFKVRRGAKQRTNAVP